MTITSGPFEDQDTTEFQFAELFIQMGSGVRGIVGSGALEVTADADGLNVDVAQGFAIVLGTWFKSTASEELTIEAADALPRIDTVVLRRNETANAVQLVVRKGTAAASPVAPTLDANYNNYEIPLADVAVAGSAVTINPGDVTDRRVWLQPISGVPFLAGATLYSIWDGSSWQINADDITSGTLVRPVVNSSTANQMGRVKFAALPDYSGIPDARLNPADGTLGRTSYNVADASNLTTGTLSTARLPSLSASLLTSGTLSNDRLDDTGWLALTLLAGSTAASTGTYGTPAARRIGKTVYLRGLITRGDSSVDFATLPVGLEPNYKVWAGTNFSGSGDYTEVGADGVIRTTTVGSCSLSSISYPLD